MRMRSLASKGRVAIEEATTTSIPDTSHASLQRMTARDPQHAVDADAGAYHGKSVARRFVSPDGLVVLVGRTAADNDIVTFKLGAPHDFWLHVSGESGSHVVVRNPEGVDRLPRE